MKARLGGAYFFQAIVSSFDREDYAIHNSLVALLIEAERRRLREEVVEPAAGSRVRMRRREGNVVLVVERILAAGSRERLNGAVPHGRVAGEVVEDEVRDAVIRVVDVGDDEGAAVQALAQAGAVLVKLAVAGEGELRHGAGDVGLAGADEVLVPCRGESAEEVGRLVEEVILASCRWR